MYINPNMNTKGIIMAMLSDILMFLSHSPYNIKIDATNSIISIIFFFIKYLF